MGESTIKDPTSDATVELAELKLWIPPDLYRAFQRCVWILVHETGRNQLEIMHELVEDFLIKHEC